MSNSADTGERICTFTYTDKFCDFSPSWSLLLGYSREETAALKMENILSGGSGAKILQGLKMASAQEDCAGETIEKVEIISCGGYKINGTLSLEWQAGKDKIFYGSFVYFKNQTVVENNMIYEYMSETSLAGSIKYDEYSNIIFADRVFEIYFDLKNATGMKTYSFSDNLPFIAFMKAVSEAEDCVVVNAGNDKLIALITKTGGIVTVKVYNKNNLVNSKPTEDLTTVLNKKRIWDKLPIMFLVDTENKMIVDANPGASEFYGYRIDEFTNMPISNISVLPPDIIEQELVLAALGKKVFFISRHRMANGQIKDVNYTTALISIGEKHYVLAFITDITRRKNLEKVIEEKNSVLMELNVNLSKLVQEAQKENKKKEEMFLRQSKLAAVGEMVSSISDYWKEPLNTIAILVQDMEDADKYGELDDKYIENMVKTVMAHLQGISSSIDTCVNFFKHDSEDEIFDVRNAIFSVIKVLDRRFAEANITVCTDCSCMTDCFGFGENNACNGGFIDVLGGVNEFKHAICNILINALDAVVASRRNGILLAEDEGLIFIRLATDGKTVSITCSDNGEGINEEASTKVFDPYFTTKEHGMGIGLYITKQLVEKNLKGSVSFANTREGATVTITLPRDLDTVVKS